jgi:hypothetical protein
MNATTAVKMMALLMLLVGASAAGLKYVAVVETDMDAQSGASASLNPAEVRLITAELRRVAVENLPRDKYNVMTSETVMSMGGAVLEECAEENCVITLGSRIGADYIVRGIISKFGTKLVIAVEMYETDNGTLVASAESVWAENTAELFQKASVACGNMYRAFLGGQMKMAGRQNNAKTANTYNDYSSDNEYKDFTIGERWGTLGLNILPGGLGSFLIMKDKVGGGIIVGANILATIGFIIFYGNKDDNSDNSIYIGSAGIHDIGYGIGCVAVCGAGLFNVIRSGTYYKPNSQSTANAANFKPYDGLKLTILPTSTGDYKVYARYDYTF